MHLRRIRLYGFKSFANDVSVEFEPGITALVGPNGGGKSNVVDAIRWVLGEQRLKDLRAERWEDLLYQGDSGKSAARVAEVFLEFDNQDGEMARWPESLTVARRYYRSGDSEYLVNGHTVRLKDITDLFLDSGLGRFSYAIISQGRVEGALLQRPNDRLEQLEEAAGVSRYKVRKRETLTHLKETETKLVRLTDLSNEVARQMEAVRSRAEAESRYRTWELLRQDWQQRLLYTEYRRAQDKIDRLEQERGRIDRERRELADELARVVSGGKTIRDKLTEENASLDSEATTLAELTEQATAVRLQKGDIESRIHNIERERAQLKESMTLIAYQVQELQQELESALTRILSKDSAGLAPDAKIRQAVQADLAEVQGRLETLRKDRDATDQELERLGAERAQVNQGLARIQGFLRMGGETDNLQEALQRRHQESLSLEKDVHQLTDEVVRLTEQKSRLKQFSGALEQEIYGLKHQLAGRQARLRALHQLDAEGAGLYAGVRAVLRGQQQGTLSGVLGTLGSLVDMAPDVSLAIETALGSSIQDVVVTSEVGAKDAVQFLKRGSLGRATFLPLDTVKGGRVSPEDYRNLARQPGVVGWAPDLVKHDPGIQAAVQHVLGRVLVLQNLDEATRLGPIHNFRYKMVTLDGQVVHSGGAITGGSRVSENNSGQSRRIEINELTRRIREDSEVVAAKEELLHSSRTEADEADQQLDQARELLAEQRHAWQELRQGLSWEEKWGQPETLVERAAELESAILAVRTRLAASSETDKELRVQSEELSHTFQTMEAAWRQEEQKRREDKLIGERIERELERLHQQEQSYSNRLIVLDQDERQLTETLSRRVQELEETLNRVQSFEKGRSERVRLLQDLREHLVAVDNRQRVLELEDRKMEQKANTWGQEQLELRVRFEAYHPPDSVGEPLSRAEEANARNEVRRITEKLNEIGPVVPGSLALFEQLEERRRYLVDESQDVEEARRELLTTLEEIDAEMERRVKVTADEVERAFSEACRQLYGGGDGGFSWTIGEQPGVDLWVRPAGKRPSHLGVLSGGEKALGGIAWLFSLLAVRPAPFVVLDEVEASLDEANAERFARYMRTCRGTAQYVVVTHQRQTMEAADALWGVAGDAQGRSRLVSVRLAEVEEQAT